MLSYLRPYVWPRFVGGAACMATYSGTAFYVPFLIRDVFDDIFAERNWDMLFWIPLVSLVVFTIRSLAHYGSNYLVEWVAQRIVVDFRMALNDRIQKLPLSFFNRTPTGSLVSRATSDVTQINNSLTQSTIAILQDTTTLVALVTAAFVLDWSLALVAFVGFPCAVLPVLQLSKRLKRHARLGQETLGVLSALFQETAQVIDLGHVVEHENFPVRSPGIILYLDLQPVAPPFPAFYLHLDFSPALWGAGEQGFD